MTTDLAEAGLERLICEALTGDPCEPASGSTVGEPSPGYGGGGWSPGNRHDYDREYCVDLCQLCTFLHATQPESAAALCLGEDREELDTKTLGETLQMAQDGSGGGRVGSTGPGSGGGQGIPQQRDGAGVEGTGITGVTVGNGSGRAQLEGEEPEVPGAGVRESETNSGAAGTTVAAAAERIGGAAVRASVHHGRVAPHLRPGPRERAQATADPRVWFQPGTADAPSDGGRYAPESAGPRPGASFFAFWGENGPQGRLWEPF